MVRAEAMAWKKLYGRPWRKARAAFLAVHPFCVECSKMGVVQVAEDVDHIVPHRGDRALFWRRGNWQPLCKVHHSQKTAREVWHGASGTGG